MAAHTRDATKKRVCVVGAGAAGLPAIRHSLLYDFEVVCYEAQEELGGLWRFNPEETEYSCVMRSTVINTSKEFTAYSDFPPPADEPNFMHNTRMLGYLRAYAARFALDKHIKFEHKVIDIRRADSYHTSGEWIVRVQDLRSGAVSAERFTGVLHCTGHHSLPYSPPEWPGQETFGGRVMHAHGYKDWRGFEDQSIVVVGVGNSGCDVAVELSRVAKQVYLVSRRGTWVFNRIHDYGRPIDAASHTRLNTAVKSLLPEWFIDAAARRIVNRRFDHELYALAPDHPVNGAHPTINDELPNRIANGSIMVRPGIARFTHTGVCFEDGRTAEVDTVVLATGYSMHFPEIEGGDLIKTSDNRVDLYQYVFPLNLPHDTLGVIGLIQPFGSIIPIAEMQTRLVLAAIDGSIWMPDKSHRLAEMAHKAEQMSKRYVKSRRHTVQVDFLPYMDELAALVGCAPPAWYSHLPSDPSLALASLVAPHAGYFYRLRGPHADEKAARAAILSIEQRMRAPMARHPAQAAAARGSSGPILLLILALSFLTWCAFGLYRLPDIPSNSSNLPQ